MTKRKARRGRQTQRPKLQHTPSELAFILSAICGLLKTSELTLASLNVLSLVCKQWMNLFGPRRLAAILDTIGQNLNLLGQVYLLGPPKAKEWQELSGSAPRFIHLLSQLDELRQAGHVSKQVALQMIMPMELKMVEDNNGLNRLDIMRLVSYDLKLKGRRLVEFKQFWTEEIYRVPMHPPKTSNSDDYYYAALRHINHHASGFNSWSLEGDLCILSSQPRLWPMRRGFF